MDGYVVNIHGDCKSSNWGCATPSKWPNFMAYTWDFLLGKQVACRMSAAKWGQLWMVVSTIFLFSPLLGEMIKFD